jgi:hypothetical protein
MAVVDKNPKNRQSNLFKALTRLFSGPIINYRSQTGRRIRRQHLDKFSSKFKSASGQQFKKSQYNPLDNISTNAIQNQQRTERYVDFDQMEYCLHADTKIAVPGGYKTLKELSDEYGTEEQFIVYAYDHAKQEIVPALGKQARKTTTEHAWKVKFENGKEIIGTANHRLMLRDGTYRRIDELVPGMAMMPFYRKDLAGTKDDTGDGYRWIYTMHNDEGRRPGWKAEHIMIAEWMSGERMLETEVVHHRNFVKHDNCPDNLQVMDNNEHLKMHQNILNEQRKDTGWWEEFGKRHSKWMQENNPAERKDITFEKILSLCDTYGFNQKKLCSMLDTDPNVIKRRLRSKGFDNFEIFAKTYSPSWRNDGHDNRGNKNPRFDNSLTYQKICETYERGMSSNELAEKLDTTYMKIVSRVKSAGFNNFTDFRDNYHNHKVESIEYYGYIDLYDLTVDGYKNFATDTVISHNTPEIASTLDIYADEMTTYSDLRPMLRINCPNEELKAVLGILYSNILNVESNLFGWSRTMCKYGDFFLYLDIDEKYGVQSVIALPSPEIERLEGLDSTNPNYIQYQWNSAGMTFENWQIAHFRILGNDKYSPYGTSILEPARRIWRQLTLMEDAMMAYRVVRSSERRVFKIDVGSVPPQDVEQYMQKIVTQLKRNSVVDSDTGRIDLRYNPMSIEEDYFIPVRAGSVTDIQNLAGGQNVTAIDDVKYLRDKLFSALKIPQAYLTMGDDAGEDKTTLAQKDIRFARTIQRLQRVIIAELTKIGIIHLYTLGFRGDDLLSFELSLNNPSKIAELQELEHWKQKFDIAASATEGFFSRRWVSSNIFGMSYEDFIRNQREMYYDRGQDANLQQVAEAGAGGGLGGELGGVLGGDMADDMGGDLDLGGDIEGGPEEIPAGEAEGGDEESPLLAVPPGSRNAPRLTPGAKGKVYRPVKTDKRQAGARTRSYAAKHSKEKSSSGVRNMMPGYSDLKSMASMNGLGAGIYEDDRSIYNLREDAEESRLFEINDSVRSLLQDLETNNPNNLLTENKDEEQAQ